MSDFQLRVNGIHSAWPAELGHDDAHSNELRETDPYRIANVSFSLLQRRDGKLLRHTVVDIGMGVMQSLLDLERTGGVHVVHEVLLTHSHFDHVAHLDWLAHSIRRNGRAEQPRPLRVYCTPETWEIGPARLFPWMLKREAVEPDVGRVPPAFPRDHRQPPGRQVKPALPRWMVGRDTVEHVAITSGRPFTLDTLRVTPMAVEHAASAPGSVGFIIEPIDPPGGRPRKVILTGDFLRIADEADPAWHDADVCFIESNTWNPNPKTGHQSILDALRLIDRWRVKRTYLIHYSGHEDALHPDAEVARSLSSTELAAQLAKTAPDRDVRLPRHAMILPDDEPWPV